MAKDTLLPRERAAKNLRALMEQAGLRAPEVARRAGVDRKTVTNRLNAAHDPKPEELEAIARVFQLSSSELLSPTFDIKSSKSVALKRLIELFNSADESGQEAILQIVELALGKRK